jgi:hypothetical protein
MPVEDGEAVAAAVAVVEEAEVVLDLRHVAVEVEEREEGADEAIPMVLGAAT